jgi:hypothetical protein
MYKIDGTSEVTPDISRSLYLIVNDERLRCANYTNLLSMQLREHKIVHLSNAKLLTHASLCFKGVPLETIDAFIQLVAACETPEGKTVFVTVTALSASQMISSTNKPMR